MTRTIQKPNWSVAVTVRRAFLEHAAELYGIVVDDADLDAVDDLDDLAALSRLLPELSDAERNEALWALARFDDA